jgi:ATP-binding cassette subfamily B (MDR/TAP) protein 1
VHTAEKYVGGLFLMAIFIFFPFVIQSALFTIVGQSVTEKIRKEVYRKLLRLPVKWYESKANSGGAAATRFAVDSRLVSNLVTSLISTLVMNTSSMIIGIILSFIFEWRLGLVGLIAMPLLASSGFIIMLFYTGLGADNKKYFEDS